MIILKNKTAEETEEIIRQVRAEIEFADEQSDIPISVAMGYAWTDAEEKNLPELIHCADEKMYKDKKRIKENTSSAYVLVWELSPCALYDYEVTYEITGDRKFRT